MEVDATNYQSICVAPAGMHRLSSMHFLKKCDTHYHCTLLTPVGGITQVVETAFNVLQFYNGDDPSMFSDN